MSFNKKLIKWLRFRFRIVTMSQQSFEQRRKWNFSRLGFIAMLMGFAILIIAITSTIIAFTSIREMIPGYPDKFTKKAIVENAVRLDSLEHEIEIRDQYLNNLKQVLLGEKPFNADLEIQVEPKDTANANISIEDVQNPEISNITQNLTRRVQGNSQLPVPFVMFPPVRGVITNSFNPAEGHFGTDIVTADDEIVRASLDGTIIMADWTVETGYTVQIQHKDNYITVYRHLKKLLVKTGDKVDAGESIGMYGNTGEISFGPHLHFEIWHNGIPLDPEKYLEF